MTAQNPPAQLLADTLIEIETAQREALARLMDVSGKWVNIWPDGSEHGDYNLEQRGSNLTIKETTFETIEATLSRSGYRFAGPGKMILSSAAASCKWDIELSLELSEDMQYLNGTKRFLSWSGNPKSFCQGVVKRVQDDKSRELFRLRRNQ